MSPSPLSLAAAAFALSSSLLLLQGCGDAPSPSPAPSPVAPVPTQKLSNGVEMPVISAGVWQYTNEEAATAVELAVKAGFTHIDTAYDYRNQEGVAKGLKGKGKVFITTKVPGCGAQNVSDASPATCYSDTVERIKDDLRMLELKQIDLMLLHFPPCHGNMSQCFKVRNSCSLPNTCDMIQAQWKAMTEAYKGGLLRAVGVSNYCSACMKCLEGLPVQPMVNQVHYQVGMGPDPQGFKSFAEKHNVVLQAWSPIGLGGKGSEEIFKGELTTSIAKKHKKSPVQVALKWILSQGVTLSTKSMNEEHLKEDLSLFDWELDAEDLKKLDAARFADAGEPSILCREPALARVEV